MTITNFGFASNILIYNLARPSGTSTSKIYVNDKGNPTSVTGATDWNYNPATKIVTVTATHVSTVTITMVWAGVTVYISHPTNTTYTTSTVPVQIAAGGGTIHKIWYNVKNVSSWIYASNQTYTVPTSMSGFANGASYTFYGWANNTLGVLGESVVMFSVTFPPPPTVTVTVTYPQTTAYATSSVPVQISASGGIIDKIWYNCKNVTSWVYNSNLTYIIPTFMVGFANGTYTFYAWANNTEGAVDGETVAFTVAIPPLPTVTVTIFYPQNTTYTTPTVPVQLLASGGTIDEVWYNCKNGTNWIYPSNLTYTTTTSMAGFINGTYGFYAYANNTNGNSGSSVLWFTVAIPPPPLPPLSPASDINNFLAFLWAGDFLGFIQAIYVTSFGSADVFYGVAIMLVIVPIYIRTKSLMFMSILWILVGSLFLVAMPLVSGIAVLFLVLGVGSMLYQLFMLARGD